MIGFSTDEAVAEELATMLANNEIVHWRRGRGEFGPRALGGSQSFYTGTDPNGTKTLNHALGRDEFMPYAPVVLAKNMPELFKNYEPVSDSLKYMTCTLDVMEGVKETYSGVVHVDGTARPEVVYDDVGCVAHLKTLLEKYEAKSGLKMLVLTSYNGHNLPTVCLADDAYQTWVKAGYVGSCLVIDRTMFRKKKRA
jgi:carbamoyltransferase